MKCINCGTEIADDSVYCYNCGYAVGKEGMSKDIEENNLSGISNEDNPYSFTDGDMSDNAEKDVLVSENIMNSSNEKNEKSGKKKTVITIIIMFAVLIIAIILFIGIVIGSIFLCRRSSKPVKYEENYSQELYYVDDDDMVFYYDIESQNEYELNKIDYREYGKIFKRVSNDNSDFAEEYKADSYLNVEEYSWLTEYERMRYNYFSNTDSGIAYQDYQGNAICYLDTESDKRENLAEAKTVYFGRNEALYKGLDDNYVWLDFETGDSKTYDCEDCMELYWSTNPDTYAYIDRDFDGYLVIDGQLRMLGADIMDIFIPDNFNESNPILYVKYSEEDWACDEVWAYYYNGNKKCIMKSKDPEYSDTRIMGYGNDAFILSEYMDTFGVSYYNKGSINEVYDNFESLRLISGSSYYPFLIAEDLDDKYYMINKTQVTDITDEVSDQISITVSPDCTEIAVLKEKDSEHCFDVYEVLANNSLQLKYTVENVYREDFFYFDDHAFACFKDYTKDKEFSTMVANGEEVENKINLNNRIDVVRTDKAGAIAYLSGDNLDGRPLNLYKNGETTLIAQNVYKFEILNDGRIVYLRDYHTGFGTLCVYKDGEETVVKDSVQSFVVQNNYDLSISSTNAFHYED